MPDELRSQTKCHLLLRLIDLGQGLWRFYGPVIERDLFGTIRHVCNWDCIGAKGKERVKGHADEIAAGQALKAVARVKRRRNRTYDGKSGHPR